MFRNPYELDKSTFADEVPVSVSEKRDIEANQDESTVPVVTTKTHVLLSDAAKIPYLPIILAFSATDAGRFVRGLTGYSDAFRYSVTAYGFAVSLALSHKTLTNMQNTTHLIYTHKTPSSWHVLTPKKKAAIISAATITVAYFGIVEAAKGHLYSDRAPTDFHFSDTTAGNEWFIASALFAGLTGVGGLLNEGFRTYKNYTEMTSPTPVVYANKVSRIISPLVGYGLAPFASFNDFVGGFTAAVLTYKARLGAVPAYTLSALALGACGVHGSLNARFVRDNINLFMLHAPNNYKKSKTIIALSLTLATSALLSFALNNLTKELSGIALKDLGIEHDSVYDPIIDTLSLGAAVNRFLVFTANIYPVAHFIVDRTGNAFSSMYHLIADHVYPTRTYIFSDGHQETLPDIREVESENSDDEYQTAPEFSSISENDDDSDYVSAQEPVETDENTGKQETILNMHNVTATSQGLFNHTPDLPANKSPDRAPNPRTWSCTLI